MSARRHLPADELNDLNEEEMDKLVQLQDMTGLEDVQVCRALLESKNWDLEATVREHLDIPAPTTDRRVTPNRGQDRNEDGPVSSLLRRGAGFLTQPLQLVAVVFRFAYNILASIVGLPNLAGSQVTHQPVSDVRQFKAEFEAKYGTAHPAFYSGTYSQALEEAKKDLRFLYVYLHCEDHVDTDSFCRETLCHDELCRFVAESQALFWACSVDTAEGYRVSQAIRESTYPFIAVIVLRQNRMMIVGRIEGNVRAADLVQRLEVCVRDNEAFVVVARAERSERSLNESIRREQDAAFAESLRQDQENERRKREAEEQKQRLEEDEARQLREEQDRKERIRALKLELVTEIPDEPDEKSTHAVRILFKLPNGQRLERRFLKSHSLSALYYFVFCHPDSPDEFEITTNFPKKVLRCKPEDNPSTLEEVGLGQSTMLFVNDMEA